MMSEPLCRLVYYSRNRLTGTPDQLIDSTRDILAAARRNNPRVGVTGALMFNAGCFAQVLEGPCDAVEHVFERIQQDERHGDVSLLAFAPADGRAFEHWSMAFVGASVEGAARYGGIAGESGYDPSRMTGETLFEVLHRLALEQEATA
jgi:hypothetical protein